MENDSFEMETRLNLAVLKDSDDEDSTVDRADNEEEETEYSSGTTLKTVYDREREPFTHIIEGVLNQIEVQDMSRLLNYALYRDFLNSSNLRAQSWNI